MNKEDYEVLKAKFLKVIASVPLPLREEIIVIVDNKPVSWNAAYGEIKQDTKNSEFILLHLQKLGLL